MAVPRVRPDLAAIPAYRPGRPGASSEQPGARAPARTFACSSNENPYPPLPSVLRALRTAADQINRYPDMACTTLAHRLADHLGACAESVVLGPGSVAVVQQAVTAVAQPGDEVVFAWRSFEAYPIVTRVAGATPVPVGLTVDGRHDVEAMAAAVTERTRAVLVCTPNNPTGTVLTATELDWLLDSVPDDVLVVVDEAYAEMVRADSAADGLDLLRRYDNVLVLRTFSKAYGLAGLRVGYGVAHPEVAQALRTTGIPFGVSSLAQAAAAESLLHLEELTARVDAIVAERDRVVAALAAQGWTIPDTQANFVWFDAGEATGALAEVFRDAGLLVRVFPGEGVRVTIAEPEANDLLLSCAGRYFSSGVSAG